MTKRTVLLAITATGILLRLASAFLSLGGSHPNEFYRLLEPIASLSGYSTRLPWEWKDGLLFVFPIEAHRALLAAASALGISGAVSQLIVLKLIYAVFSLLPLWATWRLLRKYAPGFELYGVAFLSIWPEMVYRSVRLMDYSLEAALLALAVGLGFGSPVRNSVRNWGIVGAALGLAFFVRCQSGLYLLAFCLALLTVAGSEDAGDRRRRATIGLSAIVLGYGLSIVSLGLLEMALTHRPFLDPFFRYFDFNWMQDGAARLYGKAPWHRYFSESAKYFGFAPFILFFSAILYAFFKRPALRHLMMLFLFPFFVFSLVGHKEGRFIYGFLWLCVPLALIAAQDLIRRHRSLRALLVTASLIGALFNLFRIAPLYLMGAKDVRSWTEAGLKLGNNPAPILIDGDPDFLPGGFFLRAHAPLCFHFVREQKEVWEGDCPDPTSHAQFERLKL